MGAALIVTAVAVNASPRVSAGATRPLPARAKHILRQAPARPARMSVASPGIRRSAPAASSLATLGGAWQPLGPQPMMGASGAWSGRVTALATDPTNGSIVYAGTAGGGVWKSSDAGTSWTPTGDAQVTLAIGALAIDPVTPTTIYAGTGEANECQDCQPSAGVLKSTDGGATWAIPATQSGLPGGFYGIARIVVDRANGQRIFAATTRGLYVSADGGVTWTADPVSPITLKAGGTGSASDVQDIVQDPTGVFWVAVADQCGLDQGSIASSTDGTTWTERYVSQPGAANRIAIGLAKNATTGKVVGYAGIAACSGALLGVAKTVDADGVGTWNLLSPAPPDYFAVANQGWYDNVVGVDPTNPDHALFGGVTLLSTSDGGATFTDRARPYATPPGPMHPDFHAIAPMGTLDHWYVGNDGGVWSTSDLAHWRDLNQSLNTLQFYQGAALDLNRLAGGSQDNGTPGLPHAVSDTGAQPWDERLDGDGGWTALDPTSGSSIVYAEATFLDIFKVDTATGTETEVAPCPSTTPADPSCNDPTAFIAPFVMDTTNPLRLYGATNQVYRTTTGGVPAGTTRATTPGSWASISPDLTTGTAVNAGGDPIHTMTIGEGTTSGTLLTASTYGKVWESTNADQGSPAWADITGSGTSSLPAYTSAQSTGNAWITGLAVNRTDSHEVWATVGELTGGRVFHSTNAGDSTTAWVDLSGNLPAGVVDSILVDVSNPQTIYVGTDTGTFVCQTCGGPTATGTWLQLGTKLPNVRVDAITMTRSDGGNLIAWTHGRGAWSLARPIPAPVASFNPTSLTFPAQTLGTRSAPQTVTLTNTGNAPLAITSVVASGDFSQTKDCQPVVDAGQHCTVTVTFTPTASGSRTGSLTFTDNASDNPQSLPLSGTGTTEITPTSGPDVSSWGPGRLDIFAVGPDGALWHKYYDAAVSWQGWSTLGAPSGIRLTSNPGVVSWGKGRIDVFIKGSDNALWHKFYDINSGGWSGWYTHAGMLTSAPTAASWGYGRLDVFAKGTGNDLQHIFYSATAGWTGWFTHAGPQLSSGPGAVSWSRGRIDVFALGTANDVQHIYYDSSLGGWSSWYSHGGGTLSLTGAPDASSWGPGRLDVFARATDGTLKHLFYDGAQGGWNPWASLGGQLNADPGAVSWGAGRTDVFSRGIDNFLAHAYYTNGAWSSWYSG